MKQTSRRIAWAAGAVAAYTAARHLLGEARLRTVFRDKHVLITGGSRGLGLVLARQLAAQGAHLTLLARDGFELARAREDILSRSPDTKVELIRCDLQDEYAIQQATADAASRLGAIDVLINNAGIIQVGPLATMTAADFEEAMQVHFFAPLRFALAVLPEMRRRRAGRIVNIASIGGKVALPHLVPYSASKFALTGLSAGLRSELTRDGVQVTTVIPGLMRTGSIYQALFKGQHDKEFAAFSVAGSMPGLSISAEHAARRILLAVARGDAEVILSLPAQILARLAPLAPGLTADALAFVNRALPREGGIGTERVKGLESHSPWAESALTALSRAAARRNNELPQ